MDKGAQLWIDFVEALGARQEESEMDEELLTIAEVARLLKCSRRSVVNYRDSGQLVGYRAGPRRWLFRKPDVLAFVQGQAATANDKQGDS